MLEQSAFFLKSGCKFCSAQVPGTQDFSLHQHHPRDRQSLAEKEEERFILCWNQIGSRRESRV